ncbi:hypothetical protein ACF068_21775 [Streptomyces sp. NPDC016309]|uniref:hypothetical protein n=1 Tax=Streptomyces sp. NPDC016309 TaxID=3364965 RepID=UPI00370040D8
MPETTRESFPATYATAQHAIDEVIDRTHALHTSATSGGEAADRTGDMTVGTTVEERRGCLFALSQPPLVIFLAVIGCLLLMAAVHDLFVL